MSWAHAAGACLEPVAAFALMLEVCPVTGLRAARGPLLCWNSGVRLLVVGRRLSPEPLLRLRPADSNQSQSMIEPVSSSATDSRRERVGRGQRLGRDFRSRRPIPGDRDWPLSRLSRQSRGELKTIPSAPGNRLCAGLRGGAGRTRTGNQAIMEPELIHGVGRSIIAPSLVRQDCGPIDMAPPAPAPLRWHRADPCRQ
jgi:hypothetical protein